jgi:hypothetical protein
MSQVFHPSTNTISKVSIFGAVFILAGLGWLVLQIARSSYVTQAHVARPQPVPFSHKHHVAGIGIDCRYCHTTVEESAFAGIPPTKTCMNCHSQIWADSPTLEPVRESYRTDVSLEWTRVHDVADFVYFDHSIHISKGWPGRSRLCRWNGAWTATATRNSTSGRATRFSAWIGSRTKTNGFWAPG